MSSLRTFVVGLVAAFLCVSPEAFAQSRPSWSKHCSFKDASDTEILNSMKEGGALRGSYFQAAAILYRQGKAANDKNILAYIKEDITKTCGNGGLNPSKKTDHSVKTSPPIYQRKLFDSIECESDGPYDSCEEKILLKADDQFQMCKVKYSMSSERGHSKGIKLTPKLWFEDDTEVPARFRAYEMKLWSGGDHSMGGSGANIKIKDVFVQFIHESYNNNDRIAAGCHVPPSPKAKTVPKTDSKDNLPTTSSYANDSRSNGKEYLLWFTNTGQAVVKIDYTLEVKTSRRGWFDKDVGRVTLHPKHGFSITISQDPYGTKDDAIAWRLRHRAVQ